MNNVPAFNGVYVTVSFDGPMVFLHAHACTHAHPHTLICMGTFYNITANLMDLPQIIVLFYST